MGNNIVACPAKVDAACKTVRVGLDGLVKVDGIAAFKRVERDGRIYLQFCDNDRLRASCRGTRLVEVPLETFIAFLIAKKVQ